MTPRTTMFIAIGLVLLFAGCPVLAPAQCVQNADGTITCPVLAPALPAAVVAVDAGEATPIPAADRLTLRQRREMGFTRLAVIRATTRLAREGRLPSTQGLSGEDLTAARAEIADAVAAEILGDHVQAWSDNLEAGADWGQFFEQMIAFLERLMPLILQLINLFGGLSQVTPAAAGMMAHASPLLFLAV